MTTVVQREAGDRELIERAQQGDRDAFAALYQRHFQGLYDFALRIVRDADLAADVVQSTFVKAWDAARKQKKVENVKAWLYTIAHNLAIDELRLRKRLAESPADSGGEAEHFPFAVADPSRFSDPEAAAQDRELVELVWESAAALNPQEYALLDLHLRRGLDADELSSHLSLAKSAVYTRLSRLRDSLEEAVTSTVLMRRGRRECLELDWLLEELRATEVTQPVRRAIKQHLENCERCQESKRRLVSPAAIFAGISLVPVTVELQSQIWERVASHLGLGAGAAAAEGAGADVAAPGDVGVDGAGAEVAATSGAGASAAVGAKGVALSALATGAAVVTATTLVFTGGGTKVEDPDDVRSTTHVVGRPSTDNVVRMNWSRVKDADAYSVSWSRGSGLPDQAADLEGNATSATSPELSPGRWYFNLRTRGDGDWTSTVHVGPFVIVAEQRELAMTGSKGTRRAPKPKPRLQHEAKEDVPTAPPAVDSPAVVGVDRVVATRQRPRESGDEADDKRSPSPPPPPRSAPVAESTPQAPPPPPQSSAPVAESPPEAPPPSPQSSEPATESTQPPPAPPPPAGPLSPPPPPPAPPPSRGDDGDDKKDEKAERGEQPQDDDEDDEPPEI